LFLYLVFIHWTIAICCFIKTFDLIVTLYCLAVSGVYDYLLGLNISQPIFPQWLTPWLTQSQQNIPRA